MIEQDEIDVVVCFAPPPPAAPLMLPVRVATGTTLDQAVAASGLAGVLRGGLPAGCRTGIWGKLKAGDTRLRQADQIELYRPLQADPKESRRRRAKESPR